MSINNDHIITMNSTISDEQKKIKKILDSVVESEQSAAASAANNKKQTKNENNKSKTTKNGKSFDNNITYLSNEYKKKLNMHSKSSELDDDYLENVLNAQDRRSSWSKIHTQRSYIPSLTAICMYIFIFYHIILN
jgi:hypothetical protein